VQDSTKEGSIGEKHTFTPLFVPLKGRPRWFKRNDALVLNQRPLGFKPMEWLFFCMQMDDNDV
jgi:hypothetical protein